MCSISLTSLCPHHPIHWEYRVVVTDMDSSIPIHWEYRVVVTDMDSSIPSSYLYDTYGYVFLSCCAPQALGDSDFPTVLRQLLPLMKPRGGEETPASGSRSGEDECGPDELILLLVYLYSLADEAQPAGQDTEEEELEKLERELSL